MEPTLKLLRELVALPSVNPAFLPGGDARAGERRVGEFLAATGARGGLDVHLQPVAPGRDNVWLRLAPSGPVRQRVLLASHLDTVGSEAISERLFQPRVAQGRLYGRGACDDKGCVAAMLTALMAVASSTTRPRHTEVTFIGLVDEENAQAGSRAVAALKERADLAIVGEPTRLRVVTTHKGNLWLRLEARGRSAHGSRPELGRNAILKMARVVEILETEYAARLRQRRHPLLRPPTINVGTIAGGVQPNVVPAGCAITIDRRTLPGERDAAVCAEITALLRARKLAVRLTNTKTSVCLPMETDARLPLVRQLMAEAGQKQPVGVDFFCDASVLSHGGIPSVVFGPGDIAQAHTAQEWISLASLARATGILRRFLESLP